MCGITGFIEASASCIEENLLSDVRRMADTLMHRGPNRGGAWADELAGVAFGFRRLSILDLSPLGDQPMHSSCKRYTLVFNGEIYNFQELKKKLFELGHRFSGGSDTEVILACFTEWGIVPSLCELNGMFALAVWDHQNKELLLARDRFGEKPLYYGHSGKNFIFGSELKSLRAAPQFNNQLNRDALHLYFRFGCIPAPHSIYEQIFKVEAGHFIRVSEAGSKVDSKAYWSLDELIQRARANPFLGSDADCLREAERVLTQAVEKRMVADVPLGAFLSGGIDSSLVVALMQSRSSTPVRTFTIGFSESDFDESRQARAIAHRIGTTHTERILGVADAMAVIPRMPAIYDEPFSDSSQIATYLVAKTASEQVTVGLTGDGGDEMFAGYHRHFLGGRIFNKLRVAPHFARASFSSLMKCLPASFWRSFAQIMREATRQSDGYFSRPGAFAEKVGKLLEVVPAQDSNDLYLRLVSHVADPTQLLIGGQEPKSIATRELVGKLGSIMAEFQYLDTRSYLPDDILTKVDRATMAVSLEARVPLLDPDVALFAWSLPDSMKIRNAQGKWVLRRLLEKRVGEALVLNQKTGFAVPLGEWLRGPLRPWCEELLSEKKIIQQGYLQVGKVTKLWKEHLDRTHNREHQLWDVLMFQAWLAENIPSPS